MPRLCSYFSPFPYSGGTQLIAAFTLIEGVELFRGAEGAEAQWSKLSGFLKFGQRCHRTSGNID